MPPPRRSGRQRKSNPRYEDERSWDKDTLRLLRESSQSSGSSPSESDLEIASADEEAGSLDAGDEVDDEVLPDIAEPMATFTDHDLTLFPPTGYRRTGIGHFVPGKIVLADTHSRGLRVYDWRMVNDGTFANFFGPSVDDLKPALRTRDHWLRGRDITLPSKATLRDTALSSAPTDAEGSLQTSDLDMPSASSAYQELQLQTFTPSSPSQKVTSISHTGRKEIILPPLEACNLLNNSESRQENVPGADESAMPEYQWALNTGRIIVDMAWGPDSTHLQLLAIACKGIMKRRDPIEEEPTCSNSLHESGRVFNSEIQIWHIRGLHGRPPDEDGRIENFKRPKADVYQLHGSSIRQLMWSPTSGSTDKPKTLAYILDDRVNMLSIKNDSGSRLTHPKVVKAALSFLPDRGVYFTSLAWLSTSDIAIGASDGNVSIYNLADSSQESQKPFLKFQACQTYITSLCPATSLTLNTVLAASSADGDLTLIDLRSPDQDRCSSEASGRMPSTQLAYTPLTQSWLTINNIAATNKAPMQSTIQCHHIRHFYKPLPVFRIPEADGLATAIAASPHHPSILVGTSNGSVFATNYLRKALPIKSVGYMQKIYSYQFRPDKAPGDAARVAKEKASSSPDIQSGTSHILQGGNLELTDKPKSQTEGPATKERNTGINAGVGTLFVEEEVVTLVAWNPSQQSASWAAVAWASGLVVVQDLSHDLV